VDVALITNISIMATPTSAPQRPDSISIAPLLQRLAYPADAALQLSAEARATSAEVIAEVGADEIAAAFALIFEDRLSHIQAAALLTLLHSTGKDRQADVIAKCSHCMRRAACQVEKGPLQKVIKSRSLGMHTGNYKGGLVRTASYCYSVSAILTNRDI
jgi:anthranilate phosphoribosyltransferase